MSDIATAPEQDVIAESLLGEPQEQQTVEQPGTEQQEAVQEVQEVQEQEPEELQPEDDPNWLPDEQQKVFPPEVLEKYAPRYGFNADDLSDPRIARIVQDKLNTDIYVNQLQQQIEQQNALYEEEAQPEPTQPQPQPTYEQYFQNLEQVIASKTDPRVAKEFHDGFMRVFGVPEAEIAKTSPQQAVAFTSHMSKFALNLVNTFVPDIMQAQLSNQLAQLYPGFGEMYERSAYAMAWDQVRNSNPQYASLPAYGTKDFGSTLREAQSKFPELIAAFEDGKGNIPVAKAQQAYAILAKIATGQTVDPAIVQKAVATGARNATRAATRRANGNLGSGQPRSASTPGGSRFQTNSDIFDDETMGLYQREHGRI